MGSRQSEVVHSSYHIENNQRFNNGIKIPYIFPSPISGEGGRRSLTDGGWSGCTRLPPIAARTEPQSGPPCGPPSPEMGEGSGGDSPIASIFRAINPLFPLHFQKIQRPQPAIGRPRPRLPPSRRKGGSLGRRSEAAAGAVGAGVRRCEPGEPDRSGGLLRARRSGWRTGGDTQVVPGIGIVARPARRRRCGKARTRPPDASFRITVRAERLSFAETVFLSAHPGEGPGAPPCLPSHRFCRSGDDSRLSSR